MTPEGVSDTMSRARRELSAPRYVVRPSGTRHWVVIDRLHRFEGGLFVSSHRDHNAAVRRAAELNGKD